MKYFIAILIIAGILFYWISGTSGNLPAEKEAEIPGGHLLEQRAYPSGKIDYRAYRQAIEWEKNLPVSRKLTSSPWQNAGPFNIGGRISDIELPEGQNNTVYVGAASGGVFKSTDNGATWTPVFDEQAYLAIGDIETTAAEPNTVWVGTGEPNGGGGSLSYDGNGIYKSTDGGDNWQLMGLEGTGSIAKILINPDNPQEVYAAATGPLFVKNSNRGVYKTLDGGNTWSKVLYISDSTSVIDMAMNKQQPQIVYAATWERIRKLNDRQYGGETSGIYRSTDAGATWTELTNGLPALADNKGRISIDISPSNPDILYASYANKNGSLNGIYKSTDGGDTWTSLDVSDLSQTMYHWWFGGVFIHPTDPDIVYYAGFNLAMTTDGGATWMEPYSMHVDHHVLTFRPGNADEIWVGNDGGTYRSNNGGNSFFHINSLPVTQFYRMCVDEQNEQRVYGGAQDNNTLRTITGSVNDWSPILGGDGFQPLVDYNDSNTIYAEYQGGQIFRSDNDGGYFTYLVNNGIFSGDRHYWDTPVCMDPNNASTLYYGTQRVYKTVDKGNNWTAISGDLSEISNPDGNLASSYAVTTTIDVSPLNPDIVIAGTDTGKVWITPDGGATWNKVSTSLPDRWVTKVLASPDDESTFYVTFSGYRYGEYTGHIYKSDDMGNTWTDISGDLPDIPVNDIVEDEEQHLFIATDMGVFAGPVDGMIWTAMNEGMPKVPVLDLYYYQSSQNLYAATYGRSIFKVNVADISVETADPSTEQWKVYPNPFDTEIHIPDMDGNDVEIHLYNTRGEEISVSRTGQSIRIQDGIAPGMYFLHIISGENRSIRKIIKR